MPNSSSGNRRKAITAVSAVVLFSLMLVLLASGSASAAPALSVLDSGGKVLLGGQGTIRTTVTNTGDQRGFQPVAHPDADLDPAEGRR